MRVAPRASVIIAVRNDSDGIRATLDSLSRQTLAREDFEVIVIDDGSADETAALVRADPKAVLVALDDSKGAYVARNRGLDAASGRVLAITDSGCLPACDWLERGIDRLDGRDAVVGGRIAMPLGPKPSLASLVDVVHHLDQERYIADEGKAVTANLLSTRAVFDLVGGFNEDLRSSGDVDWTVRARSAGVPLLYAPEVVVVHPPRVRAGELVRKSARVGRGGSGLRHSGTVVSGRRRPYLDPYTLSPRHRRRGYERVLENGARPGNFRWAAVAVAQVAMVQVPQALAALSFDLRERTVRRSTAR